MVDTLVEDLVFRADNNFPQDPDHQRRLLRTVADIRKVVFEPSESDVYSVGELEVVLTRLDSSKKCIRGCFAALKAPIEEAKTLTLALVNLGKQFGLTSSLWSLRQYRPLHKKGPMTVSKVANLRPISLCSDMAHVQDGLWMLRNKAKLVDYAGPAQTGGTMDPLSLVLGLVLHAQIRLGQSLDTFWAILDLKWAFDTAILLGMKTAVAEAGIKQLDWLLLDDIMDQDCQCLTLHGLLSPVFQLGCGTAQGRKFSVGVCNALLRNLFNEIEIVVPGGTRAVLPGFATELLSLAHNCSPVGHLTHSHLRLDLASDVSSVIREALLGTGPQQWEMAVASLCSLQNPADRQLALELLGEAGFVAAQHVDDTTVPCSSVGHVRAIIAEGGNSACASYAVKFKAKFHFGPGKCCVMRFGSLPTGLSAADVGCDMVSSKRLLGVLVDDCLSFKPCLQEVLSRGWNSWVQLFNAAESAGFSVSVLANEVAKRLVPEILFAGAFLVSASGFEHALNRLQWRWGRALLGANKDFSLPWALVFAQCGWPMRLGTHVLEQAAMAFAKLLVLPVGHPGAVFVRAAMDMPARSWVSDVLAALKHDSLPRPIPCLFEVEQFDVEALRIAQRSSEARKKLLKNYRMQIVRPILLEYDWQTGAESRRKLLPGFELSFEDLGTACMGGRQMSFNHHSGPVAWLWFRSWALLRTTGAWPLCLFKGEGLPLCLPQCPGCGTRNAVALHALAECPLTQCVWTEANDVLHLPTRESPQALAKFLLQEHEDSVVTLACQKVVGTCFQLLCGHLCLQ